MTLSPRRIQNRDAQGAIGAIESQAQVAAQGQAPEVCVLQGNVRTDVWRGVRPRLPWRVRVREEGQEQSEKTRAGTRGAWKLLESKVSRRDQRLMADALAVLAATAALVLWRHRRRFRQRVPKSHVDVLDPDPRRAKKMPHQPDEGFALEVAFRPREEDIVLATFPKTGNTLLSQLAHQLRRPGDNSFEDIYDVVPFLEFVWPLGMDSCEDPSASFNHLCPRVFKHHRFLSACYPTGKYVCTFREPALALRSLFNMCLDNGLTTMATLDDFVEEFGVLEEDWGWGGNIFRYYVEQWRCRTCDNVLLVSYEDLSCKATFHAQAVMLARFMGVQCGDDTDDGALEMVARSCSREWMLKNKHKFDESVTYARMREQGRWVSPFQPAARVTDGRHHTKYKVSDALKEKLQRMWDETLGKEFGLKDYADLRERLTLLHEEASPDLRHR